VDFKVQRGMQGRNSVEKKRKEKKNQVRSDTMLITVDTGSLFVKYFSVFINSSLQQNNTYIQGAKRTYSTRTPSPWTPILRRIILCTRKLTDSL
jgi:hypothetical protein